MATWTLLRDPGRSVKSAQATSESAPTTAADGLSLDCVAGFTLYVEADEGQTLSGSGTLLAYLYDPDVGGWARTPELDLTIPATAAGSRRLAFTGFAVNGPRGRMAHVGDPTAPVAVSAGGITLKYVTNLLSGERA